MDTLDEIKETFDLMEDWEDKYTYLISLGNQLPAMSDALKTDDTKVDGCTSQVWMCFYDLEKPTLQFFADSDAHIVRGLIAIIFAVYNGVDKTKIKDIDIDAVFNGLGLSQHISPNRRNGFFSMVERLKATTS